MTWRMTKDDLENDKGGAPAVHVGVPEKGENKQDHANGDGQPRAKAIAQTA